MGIKTHLGPQLLGTVKNSTAQSSTISPTQLGRYRNLGATVCTQYAIGAVNTSNVLLITSTTPYPPILPILIINDIVQATGNSTTSSTTITLNYPAATLGIYPGMLVVGPGIAGSDAVSPNVSSGGTYVTAVSGSTITLKTAVSIGFTQTSFTFYDPASPANNSPMVLPAGSIILQAFFDILTGFTGTVPTAAVILSSPNVPINLVTPNTVLNNTAMATATRSAVVPSFGLGLPNQIFVTNTGAGLTPSDSIVNIRVTNTAGATTTGLANFCLVYAVCNSDSTMNPETPTYGSANY
jgi:hypothetical protein